MARADGIDGHVNPKSFAQEIDHRLLDANVSLDSADEPLSSFLRLQLLGNRTTAAATECGFLEDLVQSRRQFGASRPQALWILLASQHRKAKQFRSIDQPSDVPDNACVAVDQADQFLLNVNNDEASVRGRHQLRAANKLASVKLVCGIHACEHNPQSRQCLEGCQGNRSCPDTDGALNSHAMNQGTPANSNSDANCRSRWKRISINRALVLDGLYFARRVPLFPAEKTIDLSEVAHLRSTRKRRVSWAVLFVKAYAIAAQRHPALRQMYVRWPWPHMIEFAESTAMVVVNRQFLNENRICWGRLEHPDRRTLLSLQWQLNEFQTKPVEQIFRSHVRLSRMPTPLRRLVYWWNFNFSGNKRAKRLGTFSMSTLAGQGVLNRGHQTFLTSSLTYGPLDEHGRAVVTLLCDHRVVDGVIAAHALADLEEAFKGPITAELRALAPSLAAA